MTQGKLFTLLMNEGYSKWKKREAARKTEKCCRSTGVLDAPTVRGTIEEWGGECKKTSTAW